MPHAVHVTLPSRKRDGTISCNLTETTNKYLIEIWNNWNYKDEIEIRVKVVGDFCELFHTQDKCQGEILIHQSVKDGSRLKFPTFRATSFYTSDDEEDRVEFRMELNLESRM